MSGYAPARRFVQLLIACVSLVVIGGCNRSEPASSDTDVQTQHVNHASVDSPGSTDVATEELDRLSNDEIEQLRPSVQKFCADCHVMPRPASSTIADWKEEVDQGFMLYRTSGRTDLEVPDEDKVLAFFRSQASPELDWSTSEAKYPTWSGGFTVEGIRLATQRAPAVTNVRWIDIGIHDSKALVYCNINTGGVIAHWPQAKGSPTKRLGTLIQPVHTEPCDLNEDGLTDLVVADIGEFNADDSDLGRVVWLKQKPDEKAFEKVVLLDGLSRISDIQPGDFDGDGDVDLLVGAFGWRNSGRTFLLINGGPSSDHTDGRPVFTQRVIDPRHGPVHVPPIDLNADGHLDFIALISQEHESVEAFLNDGSGNFRKEVIYQAPDPAYGSSGIHLADMDGDGDTDVLFTNGDSFDRGPKPHHSVQWLENDGSYPYKHHHLCYMPGVLSAKPADFDGDGDMDIVAGALLGKTAIGHESALNTPSMVYIEQIAQREFKAYSIQEERHLHLALEAGDFDGDGKQDFAAGFFVRTQSLKDPDVAIFWNKR